MSIESLPDALNFGKGSREMLSSSVMPLLHKALQKVMLQLPSNPTYHIAQYLTQNNPQTTNGSIDVDIPAIFMSKKDGEAFSKGSLRLDDFELTLARAENKKQALATIFMKIQAAQEEEEERLRRKAAAAAEKEEERIKNINSNNLDSSLRSDGKKKRRRTRRHHNNNNKHEHDTNINNNEEETATVEDPSLERRNSIETKRRGSSSEPPSPKIHHADDHHNNKNLKRRSSVSGLKMKRKGSLSASIQSAGSSSINRNSPPRSNEDDDEDENSNYYSDDDDDDEEFEEDEESSYDDEEEDEQQQQHQEEEHEVDHDHGDEDHQNDENEEKLNEEEITMMKKDKDFVTQVPSQEVKVSFVGTEVDGEDATIQQCGRLPCWMIEPPTLEGLDTVWRRLSDLVLEYEHDQKDIQQHDMACTNWLRQQKLKKQREEEQAAERKRAAEKLASLEQQQLLAGANSSSTVTSTSHSLKKKSSSSHHQTTTTTTNKNVNSSSSSSPVSLGLNNTTTSTSSSHNINDSNNNNNNIIEEGQFYDQKRVKIHWIVSGVVDVQAYVGGIPMRATLNQELCDVARVFQAEKLEEQEQEEEEYSNNENETESEKKKKDSSSSSSSSFSSFSSIDQTITLERLIIKALQTGTRLRASIQQKFRNIVSFEQALSDVASRIATENLSQISTSSFSSPTAAATATTSGGATTNTNNTSSPTTAAIQQQSKQLFDFHRSYEFHDVTVSEQRLQHLHEISEKCAAERRQGIFSVLAILSTYKKSFVRATAEFISAYFLQRQRALHLDRVGFAVSNDQAIQNILQILPTDAREEAILRRKQRDERRLFLASEQKRYLAVNKLTESAEVEQLLSQRAADRKTRRHREDHISRRQLEKFIQRAALRIQMSYKTHQAWKSLLQDRDNAVEKYSADITIPALLHVVTDHVRESLGENCVARNNAPRPKPAIVNSRRLRLVRYHRIPKHPRLGADLDVSSEEEEWYEVEEQRSSESNLETARAVVSAPVRPWDDIATLCRWCGEDRLLETSCDFAEEFSGRCSLEVRLLREFERLSYLLLYDIYLFMLWRDRTAENRFVSSSSSSNNSNNNNNNNNIATTRQPHQLSTFPQFLEYHCSKAIAVLNSPQWTVASSLGLLKPWSPCALPMSGTEIVASSANKTRELKRRGPASVLGGESAAAGGESSVNSGRYGRKLGLFGRSATPESPWLRKRRILLPQQQNNVDDEDEQEQEKTNKQNSRLMIEDNNKNKPLLLQDRPTTSTTATATTKHHPPIASIQVPVILTLDPKDQAINLNKSSLNNNNNNGGGKEGNGAAFGGLNNSRYPQSEGNRSSEFGLRAVEADVDGEGDNKIGGGGGGNKNPEDHSRVAVRLDPRLTQVEHPLTEHPFFFVSDAMPMKAVFDTSKSIFQELEVGMIHPSYNTSNKNSTSNNNQENHSCASSSIADSSNASGSGTTHHNKIESAIKGIVWVSTVAEPLLYVEEDDVITLSPRPAHAEFELNDLFPKSMFRGYSEVPLPETKIVGSSSSSQKVKQKQHLKPNDGDDSAISGSTLNSQSHQHNNKQNQNSTTSSKISSSSEQQNQQNQQQPNLASSSSRTFDNMMSSTTMMMMDGSFVESIPDPFSSNFWNSEDKTFQDRVKHQLSRCRGALSLFGAQHYSEVSDLHGVVGPTKPSRSRFLFWNAPQGGGLFALPTLSLMKGFATSSPFAITAGASSSDNHHDNKEKKSPHKIKSHHHHHHHKSKSKHHNKDNNNDDGIQELIDHLCSQSSEKGTTISSFLTTTLLDTARQEHIMMIQQQKEKNNPSSPLFGGSLSGTFNTTTSSGTFQQEQNLNSSTSSVVTVEKIQGGSRNPSSVPIVKAIRKKFRCAPENLQYELMGKKNLTKSNNQQSTSTTGGGTLAAALKAQQEKEEKKKKQENENGKKDNNDQENQEEDEEEDLSSRPMSATHSSIGSWSDVVHVKFSGDNQNNNNDDDNEIGAGEENAGGEDQQQQNTENKKQQEKQLMLPQVRTASGVELIVCNKLIAYKFGHKNDYSSSASTTENDAGGGKDPAPFSMVRFPIMDSFGKAFFDRLEEFKNVIELQPISCAFVFGLSSLTSIFASSLAVVIRLFRTQGGIGEDLINNNNDAAEEEQQQQEEENEEQEELLLDPLLGYEVEFLRKQHQLFEMLYQATNFSCYASNNNNKKKKKKNSFIQVISLLRRMNLLTMFVGGIDVHRQFSEAAARASTLAATAASASLQMPERAFHGVSSGSSSSTNLSSNCSDEFSDLIHVQKRKLSLWFAAQASQRIERLCTLVMFHYFLVVQKEEQKEKEQKNVSFFEFCMIQFSEVMKLLFDRIDPWDVERPQPQQQKEQQQYKNSSTTTKNAEISEQQQQNKKSLIVVVNDIDDEKKTKPKAVAFAEPTNQKTQQQQGTEKGTATTTTPREQQELKKHHENLKRAQLSSSMRLPTEIPFSPLHPLSNATHRSKRWSNEVWVEKAT